MQVITILSLLFTSTPQIFYVQACGFYGDDCRQTETRPKWADATPPVRLVANNFDDSKEDTLALKVAERIKSIDFRRNPKLATDEFGIFLYGIDVVSIYNNDKILYGNIKYSIAWNGGIWLFTTEKNLNDFIGNPNKYNPAYGGYCAFHMTKGEVVPATNLFYLNENKIYMFNTNGRRQSWLQNIPVHITTADTEWEKLNTSQLITLEPSPAARILGPLLRRPEKTSR